MFSIFAARMFEQRVLQAYREKIAQERQMQLLRELEAEDRASKDREARKAKENQKKKDKRRSVLISLQISISAYPHWCEQAAETSKGGGSCATGG